MTRDDDFRIRPGRIRPAGGSDLPSALRQVRVAVARAGGRAAATGQLRRTSTFGRGRAALLKGLRDGAGRRQVVVKARVVRRSPGGALGAHLRYLQRDGVAQDGEPGRLFDAASDAADVSAFSNRSEGDRHHFRFIVSPEDSAELSDLKAYTRDLLRDMEADLQTRLDWVAVDHWNTAHPHIHIVVRGRLETGDDLVISRAYIGQGIRARAEALVDLELGPPGPAERAASLARDIEARRWTRLDRTLDRLADADRIVDLKRLGAGADRTAVVPLTGRARVLERLQLAEPISGGRWRLRTGLAERLGAVARDEEIAARLTTAARDRALVRSPEQCTPVPFRAVVSGRVLARGLDDELRGSGYAVVDGLDGRLHHVTLADAAAPDPRIDAVIRISPPSRGVHPMTITLSDLDLASQVKAEGATWLDRCLIDPKPLEPAGGFAGDAAEALKARADHLAARGLASRTGDRVSFASGLLETLRSRELGAVTADLEARTGLIHRPVPEGERVSGIYRRRLDLASGRFAMIDDGLGFSLVPWRPVLQRDLGRAVSGVAGPGGEIDWRPPRTLGR